jgi:hypothetical protein
MYWGVDSALGFLSLLGYGVFVAGAIHLWMNRFDFSVWVQDEMGALRRSFTRRTVIGGFAGLREETRLKLAPSDFLRRLARATRRKIHRGALLLTIGAFLFILDFFI